MFLSANSCRFRINSLNKMLNNYLGGNQQAVKADKHAPFSRSGSIPPDC